MRDRMPGHHLTAAAVPRRRTVLVTGASGVVGRALLARLRDVDVVCLIHRNPVYAPGVRNVTGDVSRPGLGLSEPEHTRLTDQVDAVIHCAAVTEFNRTDGSLEATNVAGTQHVLDFAEAAGATVYHVSTAFVNTRPAGDRGHTAVGYAQSKSAGEDLVRASGLAHVILRPSVVIGDSETGEIAAFQGLHQVAAGLFAGAVPMIPFDPSWPIDFVPADVVADAIATVVEQHVTSGEFWITAGASALRLDQAVELCIGLAHSLGVTVDRPRFVPPELFDRLIGPVFLEALPAKVKASVLKLLEFFATYLAAGQTMPSSEAELAALGAMPRPDLSAALITSLRYWAEEKGFIVADSAREVA
jgi:thioester reductase-like protein